MGISPLAALQRAVFLDRDGVVNSAIVRGGKPFPPANVSELVINPDAVAGLPLLKRMGFLLIVVTNQPDVGRGTTSMDDVQAIHAALRAALPIDDFLVCCHDDRDQCLCRKPLPGLLLQAAEQYRIDLKDSFLIGDRWRDVEAGYRAGVRTALIDYSYQERGPDHEPDIRVKSLMEAVQWILSK
ncbi:MAG: HAD-IIIA family hydrolase [Bryobacteraceae bacterium]